MAAICTTTHKTGMQVPSYAAAGIKTTQVNCNLEDDKRINGTKKQTHCTISCNSVQDCGGASAAHGEPKCLIIQAPDGDFGRCCCADAAATTLVQATLPLPALPLAAVESAARASAVGEKAACRFDLDVDSSGVAGVGEGAAVMHQAGV
jgi:hypothetical protein